LCEIHRSLLRRQPAAIHSDQDEGELKATPILALYFSSAWCDDSQASHEHVANAFQAQYQHRDSSSQPLWDLVYVSSDTSAEEMASNLKPGWHYIPFDDEELRSNVKRYFGICAKREMEILGIAAEQRKGGIPSLILIDLLSQRVLHEDAIPDVMGDTKLEDPLSHWTSLLAGPGPATDEL
jgi:nucleoredoxin